MDKFRKRPKDIKKHEEERYEFIKEQIRPQRKMHVINFVNRVFELMVLALVFGSVAGVVFWNVNNELNSSTSVPEQDLSTVRPDYQSVTPDSTGIVYASIDKKDMAVIDEQNRASRKLSAIGDQFAATLVNVIDKNSKEVWYQSGSSSYDTAISGMFFKKSNIYYYIIAASDISGQEEYAVEFKNGETIDAEFLASDSNIGVSVLCIAKRNISSEMRKKIVLPDFGSTISVSAGSNVIITGAPNGVMYSVMTGNIIKSGISMPIMDNVISLFATDILYTEGANGIVLNTRGKVIGFINDSYKSATGKNNIGFVDISSIIDIISGMTTGKIAPCLGIEGYDVDENTAQTHNIEKGVYIASIYTGSPAYSGGMRVADVIKQIDEKDVSSLVALHNILKNYSAGDDVTITFSRKSGKGNNTKKCKIVLQ